MNKFIQCKCKRDFVDKDSGFGVCKYCAKEKYNFNPVTDGKSKNCKMDAFKPNRLRPGIFHDVFSKNMTHPDAKIFNRELKKIQRGKNRQLDDEYQGKASFDED